MSRVVLTQAQGSNKEAAIENANFPFEVKFDATQAWKKAHTSPGFDLRAFAKDYAEKKIKGAKGVGFSITLESAVEDKRERPYKEVNEATTGRRKWKTNYSIFNSEGKLLGVADKKDEAAKLAKEIIKTERADLVCKVSKKVTEGQDVAFKLEYTPTRGAKDGNYIFFALED